MDELNLQEIENKLRGEFGRGTRIVFWYDTDGSFEKSVDSLDLGGIPVWHLTERNAFRTKILLEHEEPQGKFLVYAPFAKPAAGHNHLEDTLLYSREFFADRLSLIAADINLPEHLRPVLNKLSQFFGIGQENHGGQEAISRTNLFIEAAKAQDLVALDPEGFEILAMCIVTGAQKMTDDDLLYAVMAEGDIENPGTILKLHDAGLEDSFWRLCAIRYGYDDPKPSLTKLVLSLFAIYACKDFGDAEPRAWRAYLPDTMKSKRSTISVLLDNMANDVRVQELFDRLSSFSEKTLSAGKELANTPLEKILLCGAFPAADTLLIRWMIERELAEDSQAKLEGMDIPAICEYRSRMHFGPENRAEYQMLRAGHALLSLAHFCVEDGLKAQIEKYCEKDYKVDTAYRKFISGYDAIEDTGRYGDAADKLKDLICNLYQYSYLEKTVSAWNADFAENVGHRVIQEQGRFYQDVVSKIKERVVVIISDAFRYECARELCQLLDDDENSDVTIQPMMASLPSYTALGMAQLLPHTTIEMGKGKDPAILVDGKPTATTEQRQKLLQEEKPKSAAIQFDVLRAMKTSEMKAFTSGKELIYVYHNRIDTTGEAHATENSVFIAADTAIQEIFGLIRSLSKSGNVRRFVVTADHGFIYSRRKLDDTDKLENIAGKEDFVDRRFIVSGTDYSTGGVFSVKLGDVLRNADDRYVMLPKAMSVFRCGGGMNYVHGGSSPQELIVPAVLVRTQKGIVETEDVRLILLTDIRKITNLKLKLDFYQEQPISDTVKPITFRIRFEDETGQTISNEVLYTADSKGTAPAERMVSLNFDIRKKSYRDDINYYLRLINDKTNAEVLRRQVLIDLPFTDDFGFGF